MSWLLSLFSLFLVEHTSPCVSSISSLKTAKILFLPYIMASETFSIFPLLLCIQHSIFLLFKPKKQLKFVSCLISWLLIHFPLSLCFFLDNIFRFFYSKPKKSIILFLPNIMDSETFSLSILVDNILCFFHFKPKRTTKIIFLPNIMASKTFSLSFFVDNILCFLFPSLSRLIVIAKCFCGK